MVKEILLLFPQHLGPLSPGTKRRIERHVAEQIERVGIGLRGNLREFFE